MIDTELLSSTSCEIEAVKRIYEMSFPEDERREFDALLWIVKHVEAFRLETVYKDDVVVGLLSWWNFEECRYIEHFAIDATMRGCSIVREVLSRFVARDTSLVVLEAEPPTDEMSCRRVNFYRRCGFVLHEAYPYLQPPYGEGKSAVKLCLMTYGATSDCNLDDITRLLYGRVYGVEQPCLCE